MGIINPSDDPLEQILDFSLMDGGEILLSNGVCELKQREQGVYLWLDPRSFCVINGHKMHYNRQKSVKKRIKNGIFFERTDSGNGRTAENKKAERGRRQ